MGLRTYQQRSLPCGEGAWETAHASSDSFSRTATVPSVTSVWLTEDQTWLTTNHGIVLVQKTLSLTLLHHILINTTSIPPLFSASSTSFIFIRSPFSSNLSHLSSTLCCIPTHCAPRSVTSLLNLTYFRSTLLTFTAGPFHYQKHSRQAFSWTFSTPFS